MRVQKRIPWLRSLGVGLAALALWGPRAGADVSSDRPGSVVIWPKVIADGTRDTIITLTNTSNVMVYAHCEYTEGTGHCSLTNDFCNLPTRDSCPTVPGGQPNVCVFDFTGDPPQPCVSRDFGLLVLTRQQPTMWRVSTGRFEDLLSGSGKACTTTTGTTPTQSCPGLFVEDTIGPGSVPPPPGAPFFRGELRCFQTDAGGFPVPGDALKGEATIEGVNSATNGGPLLSEYNSINVLAAGQNMNCPADGTPCVLDLNGFQGFNACPEAVDTIHYALGGEDLVASSLGASAVPPVTAACTGSNCVVQTDFTIIPCRQDYENAIATNFIVDFSIWNEFEQEISTGPRQFQCWADVDLTKLFPPRIAGSLDTFVHTRAMPQGVGLCVSAPNITCSTDAECGVGGVCAPASGVLAVVEEFHPTDRTVTDASLIGSAAANWHSVDVDGDGSLQRPGHCRGSLATPCSSNEDCSTGICRLTSTSCTAHGNADCQTTNAECTANHLPATCCSGNMTGTCTPDAGDFCDRCMNDEITLSPPPPPPQ